MKFKILIVLLFISSYIFSQKEMSQETIDFYYGIRFDMYQDIFKPSKKEFEKRALNLDSKLRTLSISKEEAIANISAFGKNATVTLTDGDTKKVIVEGTYPEVLLNELFVTYIAIGNHTLKGNNNEPIKILDFESSTTSGNQITISKQISSDAQYDQNASGSVTLTIRCITDYATAKINTSDVGKTIKLNNTYKVIEIINNKLVLQLVSDEPLTHDDLNLNLISLDETGTQELVPTMGVSTTFIDKEIYHLFKSNQIKTIEALKDKLPVESISNQTLKGKYIVKDLYTPIENDIMLYEPIYGIREEIEVKL